MKQVFQHLHDGKTDVAEVPCPNVSARALLIRSRYTLISTGTERMLVNFGKASLLNKARQQPDKVKMVLDKVRTDGLLPTIDSVRRKLKESVPMGYCNVGSVMETGAGVTGFKAGDRVASNGNHAAVVNVPVNLCARIPDAVSDEAAAFTVLGAIGLQGVRLAQPSLGEAVVVTGLGVIGLLIVQLLRAHGCRVLGLDFDLQRLALARQFGAEVVDLSAGEDPLAAADTFSRGRGVDAVIIAAATDSSEPVHQAALMCRKRGRIVLVGVTGLELSRADFYAKELSFQVSCSYGPGRYDPSYEEEGQDYPVGFVRWTEQRNFEAVLDMMADGRIDVTPLISHRFAVDRVEEAYRVVGGAEPAMGILLEYPSAEEGDDSSLKNRTVALTHPQVVKRGDALGFVGAGNYATSILIPAFQAANARLKTVASRGGVSAAQAGRKYGFEIATTDTDTLFSDDDLDAVVITTRHDAHARFVIQALEAGKQVFVEKPLCLNMEELEAIESAWTARVSAGSAPLLMVGFNRRFAPQTQKIKSLLDSVRGPKSFVMTVNAGALPSNHWTQDPAIGGGRIIGEGCHFIDLIRYLAGASIVDAKRSSMDTDTGDTTTLVLGFADGSIGTVHYFANGSKAFPKERLEVFCAGRILQLDNFRRLTGFGWPGFSKMNLKRQDKGQLACAAAFVAALREGGHPPMPMEEILEVSRVSIELA